MEEPFLTYSLSFRHNRRSPKPPELIITMKEETLAHAEHQLKTTRIMQMVDLPGYLKEDISDPWNEPKLDFRESKKRVFGIGDCAYITSADDFLEIHFPYTPESMWRITMTLHVLFIVLNWSFEREGVLSNRYQLCSVNTRCEHASMGWGHVLQGDVFPTFRRWLNSLGINTRDSIGNSISEAILEGFVAFSEKEKRTKHRKFWVIDCRARINDQGRFILMCPGNACDIAIYPENDFQHEDYIHCSFSCHNLDSAVQQLSLLAGFATLCQIAQKDMEKT